MKLKNFILRFCEAALLPNHSNNGQKFGIAWDNKRKLFSTNDNSHIVPARCVTSCVCTIVAKVKIIRRT